MSSFAETYQGLKVFVEQPNCLECPPPPPGRGNETAPQLVTVKALKRISWRIFFLSLRQCESESLDIRAWLNVHLPRAVFISGSGCSYIVREECGISYQRFSITIQDLFDFNCTTLGVHSSRKMVMAFSKLIFKLVGNWWREHNDLIIDQEDTEKAPKTCDLTITFGSSSLQK